MNLFTFLMFEDDDDDETHLHIVAEGVKQAVEFLNIEFDECYTVDEIFYNRDCDIKLINIESVVVESENQFHLWSGLDKRKRFSHTGVLNGWIKDPKIYE